MLRGRDSATIRQLFIDSLHEIYDRLFDIDVDALSGIGGLILSNRGSNKDNRRQPERGARATTSTIPDGVLQDR